MLQTMIYTMGPPLLVAALFGAWWLIMHQPRRLPAQPPAPPRLAPEAQARLQEELRIAAVVEEFEKLVASFTDAASKSELLARLSDLDEEARRRLSAECANALGTALAGADRTREALVWLNLSEERSDDYFRTLNTAIARQITGTMLAAAGQPRYPFRHVPWPGLAARSTLKAQLLHDLGRHSEVESLLYAFVQSPPMRYVRAELRRQRGDLPEALSDYRAVAAWNPDFKQVQYWIAELTNATALPLKAEPLRAKRAPANSETSPSSINPAHRPSTGTTPFEVLGLPEGATAEQIHAAYLALSRRYHPDRVAGLSEAARDSAEEEMREINRAWSQLSRHSVAG